MSAEPISMPENLENLSIPELEALLQKDFANTNDSPNVEFIMQVTEVILQKEKEIGISNPIDIDQSWSDFQNFYCDKKTSFSTTISQFKKKPRRTRRLVATAVIVAILIMLFTIPVLGYRSVFHMIGTWTVEQFHFISADESSANTFAENPNSANLNERFNKSTIHDALISYGIKKQLLPSMLPQGFEQTEFDITEKPSGDVRLHSCYKNGAEIIMMDVTICAELPKTLFEKNDEPVEILSVAGLTYYVFSNSTTEIAAVIYDNIEASICTNLPRRALLDLLDSLNYSY